jgi:hypothetical protein
VRVRVRVRARARLDRPQERAESLANQAEDTHPGPDRRRTPRSQNSSGKDSERLDDRIRPSRPTSHDKTTREEEEKAKYSRLFVAM